MNFESEAAVHAFLERQHSERLALDMERKEEEEKQAKADEDDDPINMPSQRHNGTRLKKGAFGDLLAKNVSDQENAAQENYYTKLEDMFAEEPLTAMFREQYFENPMLMDAPDASDKAKRRLRLTTIAGSIGSFIAAASNNVSPTKAMEQEEDAENNGSIVQDRSFDMSLPRPKSSRSFRKSSGGSGSGKKTKSFSKRNASSRDAEEDAISENKGEQEGSNESRTPKKTRVSISGIIQLFRTASFTRKDQQLVRNAGPLDLPTVKPRRKASSSSVLRKASKTTEATDDSRMSSSGVVRVLNRFGLSL